MTPGNGESPDPADGPVEASDQLPGTSDTQSPALRTSQHCVRCGYELQGSPVNGACPECGILVRASLQLGGLRNADPEYLATLRSGVTLYCIGGLLSIAHGCCDLGSNCFTSWQLEGIAAIIPYALSACVLLIGLIFLTRPDPAQAQMQRPLKWRVILLGLLTVVVITDLALVTLPILPTMAMRDDVMAVLKPLKGPVHAAYFAGLSIFLRRLFARVPDTRSAELAGVFRWLLPLIVFADSWFPLGWIGQLVLVELLWPLASEIDDMLQAQAETWTTPNRYAP